MKLQSTRQILIITDIQEQRYGIHHQEYTQLYAKILQSYHDLAVRLEPVILELERERNDLLIVAHESVLRVLYGYLMACSTADIPKLKFPRNEIVEAS
jgi:broad specificity phosphatase PhoE